MTTISTYDRCERALALMRLLARPDRRDLVGVLGGRRGHRQTQPGRRDKVRQWWHRGHYWLSERAADMVGHDDSQWKLAERVVPTIDLAKLPPVVIRADWSRRNAC